MVLWCFPWVDEGDAGAMSSSCVLAGDIDLASFGKLMSVGGK